MRISATPDGIVERIASWAGLVPTPLIETFHAAAVARSIMVATKLGMFEALANTAKTAEEVASQTEAEVSATTKLLNVLVTARYVRCRGSEYALTRSARKWLLRDSASSLHDNILFRFLEWEAIERLESYVKSGEHMDVHDQITGDQWETYQRGMRSLAGLTAPEIVRRLPIRRKAESMLDIGGAHGYYSVALCRRHSNLRATVLDLPEAVKRSAPILAHDNSDNRVVHREGDALSDDLGSNQWDLIFMSQLIHHFDEPTNRALLQRAATALRSGGTVAILDAPRTARPSSAGQTGAIFDLFFAMTSNSGCWPAEQIREWLHAAGLRPLKPIHLLTAPGLALFCANKE